MKDFSPKLSHLRGIPPRAPETGERPRWKPFLPRLRRLAGYGLMIALALSMFTGGAVAVKNGWLPWKTFDPRGMKTVDQALWYLESPDSREVHKITALSRIYRATVREIVPLFEEQAKAGGNAGFNSLGYMRDMILEEIDLIRKIAEGDYAHTKHARNFLKEIRNELEKE